MAVSSDDSYGSISRVIYHKIDIYLDGDSATPLSVTRNDYIVSSSILEEATSGDTPFDSVSANELTFSLYNSNNLFTPTNTSSTYYGKMKRGVKVIPYFRTSEDDDWGAVGTFYITDWSVTSSSNVAAITADDEMYSIFSQSAVDMDVVQNELVSDFLTTFFAFFLDVPVVGSTVTQELPYAYNTLGNKEFLSAITTAFLLSCCCDHAGVIQVKDLSVEQDLRATLTDSDQILSVDVKLSVSSDYDSAYLVYRIPQASDETAVFNLSDIAVAVDTNTLLYNLDYSPLIKVKSISFTNTTALIELISFTATSKTITVKFTSDLALTTTLNVNGSYITTVSYELGEQDENPLSIDSVYIQDADYATTYKAIMDQFSSALTPVAQATIRGNPNLEIGDKVRLYSVKYGVDFTGVLMRQKFTYNGGLSCDITLLNTALLEVTS